MLVCCLDLGSKSWKSFSFTELSGFGSKSFTGPCCLNRPLCSGGKELSFWFKWLRLANLAFYLECITRLVALLMPNYASYEYTA